MKTLYNNRFLIAILFFITGLVCIYSCKCAKCVTTPPPLNSYAMQLVSTNHSIDSAYASEWILRYYTYRDSICNNSVGSYRNVLNDAEAFNKEYMNKLLCLDSSIGVRVHYGMDSVFQVHQIITAVDQYGNDLYFVYKEGDPIPLGGTGYPGEKLAVEKGMPDTAHRYPPTPPPINGITKL